MKLLRKNRGGDLTGPNSPYRTERAAYWAWAWIRHPIDITWYALRYIRLEIDGRTSMQQLPVYGNFTTPAYSGVQLDAGHIQGTAEALRLLGGLLLERADHVEAVQKVLDRGEWPTFEESWAGVPDGERP